MYRQGNFVAQEGVLPDEVIADLDNIVGVFAMPGKTANDKPVLGGGDLAGIFSKDNESAQKLVQFLASADFGTTEYGASGNWISPRTDFDVELYPTETWKTIAQIAYESTEFVFDGSDQMPGEVGSGSVLARHDRVDQRRTGRQDDAGQHRGQLAAVESSAGAPGGDRPAPPAPSPSTRPHGAARDHQDPQRADRRRRPASASSSTTCSSWPKLPGKWEDRLKPYLYLLPALAAIGLYLIYPSIQTFVYSFANNRSTEFVGFDNYTDLFASPAFRNTLFNTFLWILVVPAGTIVLGLLIATLADRLRPRGESREDADLPAAGHRRGERRHLAVRLPGEPADAEPDRPAQRDRHRVRRGTGELAADQRVPVQQLPAHGHAALDAGGLRDGAAVRGDQGRADRDAGAARLDGAGEGAIFFRIVIRGSAPR